MKKKLKHEKVICLLVSGRLTKSKNHYLPKSDYILYELCKCKKRKKRKRKKPTTFWKRFFLIIKLFLEL